MWRLVERDSLSEWSWEGGKCRRVPCEWLFKCFMWKSSWIKALNLLNVKTCLTAFLLTLSPRRLWGHYRGKLVSRLTGAHPQVELATVWLQVGAQAGHALPVRGVQSSCHLRCSLWAQQGALSQRNPVRLPTGEQTEPCRCCRLFCLLLQRSQILANEFRVLLRGGEWATWTPIRHQLIFSYTTQLWRHVMKS